MLHFALSGRQQKELIERGRKLRIALPLPDDWRDDEPIDFARATLAGIDRSWIRSAELVEVAVMFPVGGEGLAGSLGDIIHMGDRSRGFTRPTYRILAVVADIAVAVPARHAGRTQWPVAIDLDGERFPSEARKEV